MPIHIYCQLHYYDDTQTQTDLLTTTSLGQGVSLVVTINSIAGHLLLTCGYNNV